MLDNGEKFVKVFSWKIIQEEAKCLGADGYWRYCTVPIALKLGAFQVGRLVSSPSTKMKCLKNADFVQTLISNIFRVLPFHRNQPL
jgi:hypothetical protein